MCGTLLQQVNQAALTVVAHVSDANYAYRIALRKGQGLDDLEFPLCPFCPLKALA